jgi:signal transduction histidine kinase
MTVVSPDRNFPRGQQRGHEATRSTRGLLHDLGHQLMTLSLLTESVGSDDAIRGESRRRIDLVRQEMLRAMDMITDHLAVDDLCPPALGPDPLDLREVASQAAQLAELSYGATIELLPAQPATARVSPAAAWRVLFNLVDNAARSAGPGGHVQISVRQDVAGTIIDVLDDGPGLGRAPGGVAGLGLSVVRQLVDAADGRLEVADRPDGGTRARVVFGPRRERVVVPAYAGTWR